MYLTKKYNRNNMGKKSGGSPFKHYYFNYIPVLVINNSFVLISWLFVDNGYS